MNECLYYKTLTIRLDNIVAIIFQKNYQFALLGLWQVFAVATTLLLFLHVVIMYPLFIINNDAKNLSVFAIGAHCSHMKVRFGFNS